jgi:hypothetical protein
MLIGSPSASNPGPVLIILNGSGLLISQQATYIVQTKMLTSAQETVSGDVFSPYNALEKKAIPGIA